MFNVKILVVAAVAVVVVAVGLLSTQTWNPSWNPFEEPFADKIVEGSIAKLFSSKSFRAEADFVADVSAITSQGDQQGKIVLSIGADFDLRDKENMKNATALDIIISAEGMEFSVGLETVATADGIYFNLANVPAFLPLPIDLSAIKGQWFGLEKDLLKEIFVGEDFETIDEAETKQFVERLSGILSDKEIFSIEKSLGVEKVGADNAEHYLVALRKEAVKEIVPELFELVKEYIPSEQMSEYQVEAEQSLVDFPQKVDLAWQEMDGFKFDIWIGDGILRKIQWQKSVDLSEVQDLTSEIAGGNVSILLEVVFSDFDKKFDIKAPADYRPFEDILTLLGTSFANPADGSFDSFDSLDFSPETTE